MYAYCETFVSSNIGSAVEVDALVGCINCPELGTGSVILPMVEETHDLIIILSGNLRACASSVCSRSSWISELEVLWIYMKFVTLCFNVSFLFAIVADNILPCFSIHKRFFICKTVLISHHS